MGKGNAALLSDALTFAKPEDLKNGNVIKVRVHYLCARTSHCILTFLCSTCGSRRRSSIPAAALRRR